MSRPIPRATNPIVTSLSRRSTTDVSRFTPVGRSVPARLAELAQEYGLKPAAQAALTRYLELLAADEHAPTAVREPVEAVDRHIADALSGLAVPELAAARTIAALGAGAGVPSLVLAAALPEARVFAVESAGRKCAFLERAADAC